MKKRSDPGTSVGNTPAGDAPGGNAPAGKQALSERDALTVESLLGLGGQSARKSYYPELADKLEELEQERNRYKSIFEHAQHGIFQSRLDDGLSAANPALAKICGYTDPQHICQQVTNFAIDLLYHADEYPVLLEKLRLYGKLFGYETEFRRRDGSRVSVSMNVLLKQDEQGAMIEAFVQDITERKKAEAKLKQLNEELEQRVEERTHDLVSLNGKLVQEISERSAIEKELKVAKEAAEAANRSKDKYLAAASHDLLQPLNAARLLVSTLRERELEEGNDHLVERIHLALEGAEELLTDLLDISRLDQNAVQPDIMSFPLSYLFNALRVEFQPLAKETGIGLHLVETGIGVTSDTRLLMRILRNFMSNAFRYTGSGKILLGVRRRGDKVSIQVWDTGPGIPENRLQDIFREFQQLEEQQKGGKKGVGLGLAIVERIAQMLNHRISVLSNQGKGTMFSVEVPVSRARFQPVAKQSVTDYNSAMQGQKLLVIDNEESILVSMEALLEQWNCEVSLAASEAEAIQVCIDNNFKPDLIVADFHLDGNATGVEAITGLRKHLGADLPAIIITADRSQESRRLFREHQLPVLNKPVKPGKLRALLSHLLD
ncbi:PAS domain-containing hybrid sensor histidine kinase/response regulator [Amphritea sp. HPY]|uniref:PAS domain-containing hybrid sensor histidine kinase/response regulator n=1 Tax=Amphritea sp. HPY TaxID=3421652 RepID=UPI003D7E62DD